jgi:hypothetical protein
MFIDAMGISPPSCGGTDVVSKEVPRRSGIPSLPDR